MAIQHRDITDPNCHEPKGISSAIANTIYVSNGDGTGSWRKITSDSITGESGAMIGAIGEMTTSSSTPLADTGGTYILVSGTGTNWQGSPANSGVNFSIDSLTVSQSGTYKLEVYVDTSQIWKPAVEDPDVYAGIPIYYAVNGSVLGFLTSAYSNSVILNLSATNYVQLYARPTQPDRSRMYISNLRLTLQRVK